MTTIETARRELDATTAFADEMAAEAKANPSDGFCQFQARDARNVQKNALARWTAAISAK